jgi:TolA-binding protein
MNMKVKMTVYAVLLLLAVWLGWGFHANYATVTREAAAAANEAPVETVTNPPETTNSLAASTNETAKTAAETNAAQESTNSVPPPAHGSEGTMIAYLAGFVGVIVGLGIMIAHDVTQFAGNVAIDALLDVGGEGERDPDYEKAEDAWAKGKFLDAIELMREFLKKNPRAQYAALRIAEIYEKDLNNNLAAALEYEEVLKQKLPAERWAWAAVHLCNLYSKLGQQDKTRALLQRIADEYPKTAAAKKARSRLGLPESEPAPVAKATEAGPAPETGEEAVASEKEQEAGGSTPPSETMPPPPPPKPNLPPGFRPK